MSSWGKSWLAAWGKSWGAIAAKVEESSGGLLKLAQDRLRIIQESDRLAKQRKKEQELEQERVEEMALLERIESERNAEEETERQYSDLVARLSVVEPQVISKPVELAPDAIDRLASIRYASAQGVRLALNEHAKNSPISIQVADDTLQNAAFLNDDEAMALIMILAEID